MIKVDLKWGGFVCQRDTYNVNPYLYLTPYPTLTVPMEGSSGEIVVSSNTQWTCTNSVDWISFSPTSGSKDFIQRYVCQPFLTRGRYRDTIVIWDTIPSQIQRPLRVYQKGTDEFLNLFETVMVLELDEVSNQEIISFKGESNSRLLRFDVGPGDLGIRFAPDGFLVDSNIRSYSNFPIPGDPGKDAAYNFEFFFNVTKPLVRQFRYINVFTDLDIFATIRIEIKQREYSSLDYNKIEYS